MLRHALQQGAKREARKRLEEHRAFHDLLEEFRVLNKAEPVLAQKASEKIRRGKRYGAKGVPDPKQMSGKFSHVCLVDAMRSLGVKVPYLKNGPFWALADGNPLLEPFQCLLGIRSDAC